MTKVWIRRRNPRSVQSIGRLLKDLDGSILNLLPSCQEKCDLFCNIILMGLDTILLKNSVKLHCKDKPWTTPGLKILIAQRQKTLASRNLSGYDMLVTKLLERSNNPKLDFMNHK